MRNAVLLAVLVMLGLSLARVHVVLSLFTGALVGGLLGRLGLDGTMVAFSDGLAGGAQIALSYALLGAFAMSIANSGLPDVLAGAIVKRLNASAETAQRTATITTYALIAGVLAMAVASQNLIPVHIAFIPLLIPPLLTVMDRLQLDRRLVACALTFGLVTTYMFIPFGFGSIFLNEILLRNIERAGMDTGGVNVMAAMGIPALGMVTGLLIAVFFSYRHPRAYAVVRVEEANAPLTHAEPAGSGVETASARPSAAAATDNASSGAATHTATASGSPAVPDATAATDNASSGAATHTATASGSPAVPDATGAVAPLVEDVTALFAGNKAAASFAMLVVGLVVTMGIGSSFSTLPIIATIYVPLCISLGFSPLATVSLIGTAGALGDAGSPASDSTLGPTSGLNADGQHDHIRAERGRAARPHPRLRDPHVPALQPSAAAVRVGGVARAVRGRGGTITITGAGHSLSASTFSRLIDAARLSSVVARARRIRRGSASSGKPDQS